MAYKLFQGQEKLFSSSFFLLLQLLLLLLKDEGLVWLYAGELDNQEQTRGWLLWTLPPPAACTALAAVWAVLSTPGCALGSSHPSSPHAAVGWSLGRASPTRRLSQVPGWGTNAAVSGDSSREGSTFPSFNEI